MSEQYWIRKKISDLEISDLEGTGMFAKKIFSFKFYFLHSKGSGNSGLSAWENDLNENVKKPSSSSSSTTNNGGSNWDNSYQEKYVVLIM